MCLPDIQLIQDIKFADAVDFTGAYRVLMSLGAAHAISGPAFTDRRVSVMHELNLRGSYVRFDETLDMNAELDRQAFMVLQLFIDRVRPR